jgi:hypothetical protein
MAYSSTNQPQLLGGRTAGGVGMWGYVGTDSIASQAAVGFITDGHKLGMKIGDAFLATVVTTAGAYTAHSNGRVSAVTASSAATITFVSSST